jgi:membrane carboxypeptidase/penicillin-binding protein
MREWHQTHPARPFNAPPGIVTESICTESGKLATAHCASVQPEFFSSATAPRRECDLHSVAGDPGRRGLRTFEDATLRIDEPAPQPPRPPGD